MQRSLTGSKSSRRRALTVVTVAVTIPVLLGAAALTIDVGLVQLVRADLQRTADAASLAGTADLSGGGDIYTRIEAGRASALQYVALNPVLNQQPVICDGQTDIEFGQAVLDEEGTSIQFTSGAMPPNAVRVTVHYDVGYTFARFFGLTSRMVSAAATAAIGARDFMIAIDASGSMTKQSDELEVCADLDALGIPHPPPDPNAKPGKGPCVQTALALTYDGVMGGPEFWGVFSIGDQFLPPSVRILPSKSAKDAAVFGVDTVENAGYDDQIGTESFEAGAPWAQELTINYDTVRAKIRGLTKYGGSDIDVGILAAMAELQSVRARQGADKVMVVFADGQSDAAAALAAAQVAADAGITIHCVGLGTGVDQALLDGIAAIGGGVAIYVLNNTDESVYGPQLMVAFESIASGQVGISLVQ